MTPQKRICCADEACSFGKVCTNPLLWTVCSASNHEMNSELEKNTSNDTQAVAGMNSQIRISESSDSEQHDESDREARRETHRPVETRYEKTPEEEVADTVADSIQIFFLWYEEFGLNSIIFVENPSYCS